MSDQNAVEILRLVADWKQDYFRLGDLTGNELTILRAVACADKEVSMGEVAAALRCGKSAASQLVARLEEKGLVERSTGTDDRRVVYVRMTGAGRARFEENKQRFQSLLTRYLKEMGDEDAAELVRLLKKSHEIFQTIFEGESSSGEG